jgi:hypothetical protein
MNKKLKIMNKKIKKQIYNHYREKLKKIIIKIYLFMLLMIIIKTNKSNNFNNSNKINKQ